MNELALGRKCCSCRPLLTAPGANHGSCSHAVLYAKLLEYILEMHSYGGQSYVQDYHCLVVRLAIANPMKNLFFTCR